MESIKKKTWILIFNSNEVNVRQISITMLSKPLKYMLKYQENIIFIIIIIKQTNNYLFVCIESHSYHS